MEVLALQSNELSDTILPELPELWSLYLQHHELNGALPTWAIRMGANASGNNLL